MRLVTIFLILCQAAFGQLVYATGNSGLATLSWNGVSFHASPDAIFQSVVFADGYSIPSGSLSQASAVRTFSNAGPVWFQHIYRNGLSYQITYRVDLSTVNSDTLRMDVALTNNDSGGNALTVFTGNQVVKFAAPSASDQYSAGLNFRLVPWQIPASLNPPPYAYLSGAYGKLALWKGNESEQTTGKIAYTSSGQTSFSFEVDSTYTVGGVTTGVTVAAGATLTRTYYLKFGTTSTAEIDMLRDPLALHSATYPSRMNWPDRRPIRAIFIADDPSKRSATNPRGYFRDNTLDVFPLDSAKQAAFTAELLSRTNTWISTANGSAIKAQGFIIWDLEGQEINQAFSYVGAPNTIASMSPEMDGAADAMFAAFRAAGYRYGMTIRPQTFGYGNTLPGTCKSADPNQDIFVKLDATYPFRGYNCLTDDNWNQGGANQPGGQKDYALYTQMLDELRTKITYAVNRWGASIFYIDSAVFFGGNAMASLITYQLQAEFPDVLMIPEFANSDFGGSGALYRNLQSNQPGLASATPRLLYPNAFAATAVFDCGLGSPSKCTTYATELTTGSAQGDVAVVRGFCCTDTPDYLPIWNAAIATNATLTMTDNGTPRTFRASPGTSFTFPLVMRVYFAADSSGLAASITYCEQKATTSCYLSGVLQPTATLDLSTTPVFQIRYYNYAGGLVSNPGTFGRIP